MAKGGQTDLLLGLASAAANMYLSESGLGQTELQPLSQALHKYPFPAIHGVTTHIVGGPTGLTLWDETLLAVDTLSFAAGHIVKNSGLTAIGFGGIAGLAAGKILLHITG
jgi:hypothetical protein